MSEAPIDGFSGSKEFCDELSRRVVAKDDAVFPNAQTPEALEFTRESTHVALPPVGHIIESPANILSHPRMQIFERGDNLVREFQAGMASASR